MPYYAIAHPKNAKPIRQDFPASAKLTDIKKQLEKIAHKYSSIVIHGGKKPIVIVASEIRYKKGVKRNPISEEDRDFYDDMMDEISASDLHPDVVDAQDKFVHFTGREKTTVEALRIPEYGAIYQLGRLCAVIYEAEIDGEVSKYIHHFSAPTRPHLASSPDGEQLYIVGGRYEVTNRGIENRPKIRERNK